MAKYYVVGKLPPPMKSKQSNKFAGWMTFHPVEFSRQLCLLECEVFCVIQPHELIGQKWNKNHAEAPNITVMIARSNLLTRWIQTEIVRCEKLAGRAAMIKRFIKIAKVMFPLEG